MSKTEPTPPDRITPEEVYLKRREFIKNALLVVGTATVVGSGLVELMRLAPSSIVAGRTVVAPPTPGGDFPPVAPAGADYPEIGADEKPNTYQDITTYNNFYEFGVDKSDPAENAAHAAPEAVVDCC